MRERHGLRGEGILRREVGVPINLHEGVTHVLRLPCERNAAFAVGHECLDLHGGAHRQIGNCVGRADGKIEIQPEARDSLVHGSEIADTLEHDGEANHIVHGMVDAVEHCLDVVQALRRLLFCATSHELAGHGIDRQLSGEVIVVRESDSL